VIQEKDGKLICAAFIDGSIYYLHVCPISSRKASMEYIMKIDAALV
jgi:hypothetical protein